MIVTDANNHPVSGIIVDFVTQNSGGSVQGGHVATDGLGAARPGGWTLGTHPGSQTLTAASLSVSTTVSFTATAIAGSPSKIAILTGDNQGGLQSKALGSALSVSVRDRFDNPVAGAVVGFFPVAGSVMVQGPANPVAQGSANVATDQNGTAGGVLWILGPGSLFTQSLAAIIISQPTLTVTFHASVFF